MLAYYKGRKSLLISIIIIILDGIIIYFIPSYFNKLNYFYPMLTISLISFISIINSKNYYLLVIIGIIYDLLYSSIFLYNVVMFIFLAYLDQKIAKYFKNKLSLFILLSIINIILYDSFYFILIFLTNYQIVTINDLFYKISHSLLLNIMSVFVYWFLFKKDIKNA